jgi:hypothetical protein
MTEISAQQIDTCSNPTLKLAGGDGRYTGNISEETPI